MCTELVLIQLCVLSGIPRLPTVSEWADAFNLLAAEFDAASAASASDAAAMPAVTDAPGAQAAAAAVAATVALRRAGQLPLQWSAAACAEAKARALQRYLAQLPEHYPAATHHAHLRRALATFHQVRYCPRHVLHPLAVCSTLLRWAQLRHTLTKCPKRVRGGRSAGTRRRAHGGGGGPARRVRGGVARRAAHVRRVLAHRPSLYAAFTRAAFRYLPAAQPRAAAAPPQRPAARLSVPVRPLSGILHPLPFSSTTVPLSPPPLPRLMMRRERMVQGPRPDPFTVSEANSVAWTAPHTCLASPVLAMPPSPNPDAPFRLTVLGRSSAYDAAKGLEMPGFLPGRNTLCPAALSPSSAAAVTAASVAAARDKPMLPHSRHRQLTLAAASVVRVGLEHECARGHRVLLTANQCTATPATSTSAAASAAPRASASDGAAANAAACTTWTPQLDVPLYLPCEGCGLVEKQRRREQQEREGHEQAEAAAPLLSQLQRVFVVVPPGTTRSHHHPHRGAAADPRSCSAWLAPLGLPYACIHSDLAHGFAGLQARHRCSFTQRCDSSLRRSQGPAATGSTTAARCASPRGRRWCCRRIPSRVCACPSCTPRHLEVSSLTWVLEALHTTEERTQRTVCALAHRPVRPQPSLITRQVSPSQRWRPTASHTVGLAATQAATWWVWSGGQGRANSRRAEGARWCSRRRPRGLTVPCWWEARCSPRASSRPAEGRASMV